MPRKRPASSQRTKRNSGDSRFRRAGGEAVRLGGTGGRNRPGRLISGQAACQAVRDTDRNERRETCRAIFRDGPVVTTDRVRRLFATPAVRKRSYAFGKTGEIFPPTGIPTEKTDKKPKGHGIRRNHFRLQRNAVLRLRQARAGMAYRIATTTRKRFYLRRNVLERVHGRSSRSIFEYLLRKPLTQEQVYGN